MAFGATASLPLPIGALDNAAAFSPTQAMIDLEMNEAIYKLGRGIEVNDETCAVDLINELLFCERGTYLESEHTLAHFRDIGWNPRLFDRSYFDHTQPAPCGDEQILQQADQAWRQLVASQPPPTVDAATRRELDRITAAVPSFSRHEVPRSRCLRMSHRVRRSLDRIARLYCTTTLSPACTFVDRLARLSTSAHCPPA
jgi:trimethylamine:corrinoid methyltransferase-like protein